MTYAYFCRLWEADARRAVKRNAWFGCDRDWRPAPYSGCSCNSCRLMRELGQEDRR